MEDTFEILTTKIRSDSVDDTFCRSCDKKLPAFYMVACVQDEEGYNEADVKFCCKCHNELRNRAHNLKVDMNIGVTLELPNGQPLYVNSWFHIDTNDK